MVSMVHYVQQCPVCGRPAQVRVAHLGRQVTCVHCRGEFIADSREPSRNRGTDLLRRAEELLERVPRISHALMRDESNPWIGL